MAKEELGAKTITLNTIAPEELAEDNPTRIKTGRLVPKVGIPCQTISDFQHPSPWKRVESSGEVQFTDTTSE